MQRITIFIVSCFITVSAYAHDTSNNNYRSPDEYELRQLRDEVKELRSDVHRLQQLMVQMQDTLNAYKAELSQANNRKKDDEDTSKWACFMNDLTAGGIVGTGRTEAEARGRALESCSMKHGSCWEHKLQCNSDE